MSFNKEFVDQFLATVRKYMAIRGGLTQKDLAEQTQVGISSMSRFLNQKNREFDEQLIARIVAQLNIPLHEIIDFIAEEATPRFKKLVEFYKTEQGGKPTDLLGAGVFEKELGTAQREINANISVGGRKTTIPFGGEADKSELPGLREKLERLTPRQKAYLTDFLNLDVEGRDLIVDVGNSLFRYFKQRGFEF